MRDLIERWQRGWAVARHVPEAEDVGGGLRTECHQMGRDIEYVASDPEALPRLSELVLAERDITWLTVPTTDPDAVAHAVETYGLVVLKRSEQLMTINLADHPAAEALGGDYRLRQRRDGDALTVEIVQDGGEVAARGSMGLHARDAIADRIETYPEHRRRGLAGVVMGALAGSAREEGADHGLLIASEDGQKLYRALGWQPVADVVIAAPPGVTYPT
ncbi:GNAT family N-acetyltransferase [Actinoplanes sp. LDG1-06]|uniref:GNAT family N-acetyltransferase n=1 Tax=Paractinoplanes ovalisporus TaxID=2810368 RepID=A0ABS2AIF0_9ACTN|nr:GNAT family N-acetyltransferase [Actinoplanes ovalisporus]MBM2619601.1 GNAT family N-acetyltransferase [Actinoplanes ovalisporus]